MPRFDVFHNLGGDIWYGLRLLARNPVFTTVAVIPLALGIGANVAVFTLANAFLFKNLPFDDSDRILYISSTTPLRPGSSRGVSYPDFLGFSNQVKSFDGLAAFVNRSVDVSDKTGFPERYRCPSVTANSFSAIGQKPVRGRDFLAEDEKPGAPPVAILSYGLWQARYGGDPSIAGKAVRINDVPTEIIGVMPRGFTFPGASDLWMPLVRTGDLQRRDSRTLTMFGKLSKSASPRTASAELTVIASRLAAAYPATNKDIGVLLQNFNDRFNGGTTARLFVSLLWAVAFVLLIACANVANLLLSRAVARSREVSIRSTLGASRWRVIRQLLAESLILAALGASFGWLLALWGVRIFDASLVPAVKPPYIDFSMDARVIVYLAAITLGTGILFGLAPALQLSKLNLNAALKEGGNAVSEGRKARLLSGLLIVMEVSLAVVLLAGAGLMVRSLLNTTRAEIGVETADVLSMNMSLRNKKYPRAENQILFHDNLKARLEALPGVEVASVASDLPAESPDMFACEVEGASPTEESNHPRACGLAVGEDYFRVMRVSLQSGRFFTRTDVAGSLAVVIVNQAFVRDFWPKQDALGKRVRIMTPPSGASRGTPPIPGPWLSVVGIVPDILQDDESFEISPVIYWPFRQQPQNGMEVVLRTRVPPATLGNVIRREVQAVDEDLAVRSLRSLEESLWFRNWRYRVFGSLFVVFAVIALMLASMGLYAVVAQSVSRRTREIGARMALGATSGDILRLVFKEGMLQLAFGLAIGLAAALAATRVISALLVGVAPSDSLTYAGVIAVLAFAGALGCAIPARRAMRVDPIVALRNE